MFLEQADKDALKATWRLVVPIKETAATLFYKRLFELKPEYQALFKEDWERQKSKLVGMLDFIVTALDWPEEAWHQDVARDSDVFLVVLALGRRHSELYRIPDEAYDAVRESLIFTLDYGLGKAFDVAARRAWERLYNAVAMTMRLGKHSVAEDHASAAAEEAPATTEGHL